MSHVIILFHISSWANHQIFHDYQIQHLIFQYPVNEHKQTHRGTEIGGVSLASMKDRPDGAFSTSLVIIIGEMA